MSSDFHFEMNGKLITKSDLNIKSFKKLLPCSYALEKSIQGSNAKYEVEMLRSTSEIEGIQPLFIVRDGFVRAIWVGGSFQ